METQHEKAVLLRFNEGLRASTYIENIRVYPNNTCVCLYIYAWRTDNHFHHACWNRPENVRKAMALLFFSFYFASVLPRLCI